MSLLWPSLLSLSSCCLCQLDSWRASVKSGERNERRSKQACVYSHSVKSIISILLLCHLTPVLVAALILLIISPLEDENAQFQITFLVLWKLPPLAFWVVGTEKACGKCLIRHLYLMSGQSPKRVSGLRGRHQMLPINGTIQLT